MEATANKKYKEPPTTDPLIRFIQQKRTLFIAPDGRKSSSKLGGGWIIADEEGGKILSEFNLDFGDIA